MKKFMAIYIGFAPTDPESTAPVSEDTIAKGMAAWGSWMNDHASQIIDSGGPLGKTKQTSASGVSDIKNTMTGYVIIEAESHDAAAKLFENHPHFSIFPGDSVEIMECLPIPGT